MEGMGAIKVRSQGLMNFTQAYRKLTRIPNPVLQQVKVKGFLNQIETLFRPVVEKAGVKFSITALEENSLLIDQDLMQQVIINLLKNALEAVEQQSGSIDLIYSVNEEGQSVLEIRDNGKGIPEEIAEQIFIPFYTTKEDGSGIGLSLARQIIQLHGGSLHFKSNQESTIFIIKL